MAEQKDPELTSSHGHTTIITSDSAAIDEKAQNTSRKDLLTKDIKKEP